MKQVAPLAPVPARTFSQLLSSTRRGARLARLLTVTELHAWGAAPDLTEHAELVVGELAANAVLHGRANGRDFRLGLVFDPSHGRLRIDVTDARGDRSPQPPGASPDPDALCPGGRGLLLVAALADSWDTVPYPPSGKTVRAFLTGPPRA
ncbi:ATP-binding protein [Streptomyces montanisoli]|uniref:ATP-binding protein n=1 Tax=Streptomyces montanisoli TaxID=2798581 RepID=A0A940RU66_9ACTN|nr:ATP-binding protein [Streptomyces montanisoli]MBP0456865.1 ATP-binding protein [Streptomyces montanisoli]